VTAPQDTADLDQTDIMVAIDPETNIDYKNALLLAINKETKYVQALCGFGGEWLRIKSRAKYFYL